MKIRNNIYFASHSNIYPNKTVCASPQMYRYVMPSGFVSDGNEFILGSGSFHGKSSLNLWRNENEFTLRLSRPIMLLLKDGFLSLASVWSVSYSLYRRSPQRSSFSEKRKEFTHFLFHFQCGFDCNVVCKCCPVRDYQILSFRLDTLEIGTQVVKDEVLPDQILDKHRLSLRFRIHHTYSWITCGKIED